MVVSLMILNGKPAQVNSCQSKQGPRSSASLLNCTVVLSVWFWPTGVVHIPNSTFLRMHVFPLLVSPSCCEVEFKYWQISTLGSFAGSVMRDGIGEWSASVPFVGEEELRETRVELFREADSRLKFHGSLTVDERMKVARRKKGIA